MLAQHPAAHCACAPSFSLLFQGLSPPEDGAGGALKRRSARAGRQQAGAPGRRTATSECEGCNPCNRKDCQACSRKRADGGSNGKDGGSGAGATVGGENGTGSGGLQFVDLSLNNAGVEGTMAVKGALLLRSKDHAPLVVRMDGNIVHAEECVRVLFYVCLFYSTCTSSFVDAGEGVLGSGIHAEVSGDRHTHTRVLQSRSR